MKLVLVKEKTNVRKCLRCGENLSRWTLLGIDLNNRWVFSFGIAAVLALLDLCIALGRGAFHPGYAVPSYMYPRLSSSAIRFLLAYFVAYPVAIHTRHVNQNQWAWRDRIVIASMIPLLFFTHIFTNDLLELIQGN